MVPTDEQIATMSHEERADLVRRLGGTMPGRPRLPLGWSNHRLTVVRRARLGVMTAGVVVLIPWIVYLAATLPERYDARHWRATWVGFDVILLVLMTSTVAFGLLRRRLVVPTAFATGVLLVCDAWFDVMTASSQDLALSAVTALLVELPVALLLVVGTVRLVHLVTGGGRVPAADLPLR